jgi:dihydrodipicolinate synthase/N-acetylneuraminate lyase
MQAPGDKIAGNWATLLLPINTDDSIDFGRLAVEIDALIAAKVDGIYSNGTAGEFHNQTEDEFDRIQTMLAEKCTKAGQAFIIGACQPDARLMLGRVARAKTLAPRAIQVILPDWWPVSNAEARDFLGLASETAGVCPLILYNPPHAKRVLQPSELAAILSGFTSVVGIKLADGDDGWYAQARTHLSHLQLFVPGHHLATGTKHGVAAGAFSNVACLSPGGAQRWTDMMATDLEGALDIERRLQGFINTHVLPFAREQGFSNAALDKLMAAIGNWAPVGTRLRRPYRFIDPSEAERLRPIAEAAIPEIMLG